MDAPPGYSANATVAQRGLQALNLAYTEQRSGPNTILSRVSSPARTVQLLGRCAVQRLCSLSGAVSWDDATRRLAWSAEAQPDLAEGPQHSDQLRLTLLQEAGGGRLETDWRQRRYCVPLGSCVERAAYLSATASSGSRLELSTSLCALGRALTSRVKSDMRQGTLLEIESAPGLTRGHPAQSVLLSSGGGSSRKRRACMPAAAQQSSSGLQPDLEGKLAAGQDTTLAIRPPPPKGLCLGSATALQQVVTECSGASLRAAPLAAQAGCMSRWQHPAAAADADAAGNPAPIRTQAGNGHAQGAQLASSSPREQRRSVGGDAPRRSLRTFLAVPLGHSCSGGWRLELRQQLGSVVTMDAKLQGGRPRLSGANSAVPASVQEGAEAGAEVVAMDLEPRGGAARAGVRGSVRLQVLRGSARKCTLTVHSSGPGPQLRCQWGAQSDRPKPPAQQLAPGQQLAWPCLRSPPAVTEHGWGCSTSKATGAVGKPYGAVEAQMPDAAEIQRRAGLDVRLNLAGLFSCRLAAAHVNVCHVI